MQQWTEIQTAKSENRHELILNGSEISKRISQKGLPQELFDLVGLNFLNISDTCLEALPQDISKLSNLQSLLLHSNKLTVIPSSINKLTKLKLLDVSRNQISKIEADINALSNLVTLNLSANKLDSFPSLDQEKLTVLDVSHNDLRDFPDICNAPHISELRLNANSIGNIPHSIAQLGGLKCLDLSDNKIAEVPAELSDNTKLKEVRICCVFFRY